MRKMICPISLVEGNTFSQHGIHCGMGSLTGSYEARTEFVRASYELVKLLATPMSLHSSSNTSQRNSPPLSVKISPAPNLRNTFSNIALATETAVLSLKGTSIMYLVKTQIVVGIS